MNGTKVGISLGLNLLETLTSALYEDPIILFREYVQNSADSFTSHPVENFKVDININKEKRTITVLDNGAGIDSTRFESTMLSIADSTKNDKNNQIGFRGIGRLSALPFCGELRFTNKNVESDIIQTFSWDGKDYLNMLSIENKPDLEAAIKKLSEYSYEKYNGDKAEHFFKVELISYTDEVAELLDESDFKYRLSLLLPLNYSDDFAAYSEQIYREYKKVMHQEFNKYEFNVFFNDENLRKPFDESHILESGIIFWTILLKSTSPNLPDDIIGLLWFSFNRKITSLNKSEPRGIWVRSKNMLVGNEYTLADAVSKNNNQYITTFRELTQTLNGVHGEMLIDTKLLSDNARRDWFKIDKELIRFRAVIADFLSKLYNYRRKASAVFNDVENINKKDELIDAYINLTSGVDLSFFKEDIEATLNDETKKEKLKFEYADEDIPNESIAIRKFYDKILKELRVYCINNDPEELKAFFKMRVHLKKSFDRQ